MEYIEYKDVQDRTRWGSGPWDGEPDKIQFVDKATRYPCLIVRNRMGALCGYVGVSEGHPAFRKDYGDVDVEVHGGLTFASMCSDGDERESICHIPSKGEPDHVWWLGFDCLHVLDQAPSYTVFGNWKNVDGSAYRNIGYVKREIASLAKQLKEIERKGRLD